MFVLSFMLQWFACKKSIFMQQKVFLTIPWLLVWFSHLFWKKNVNVFQKKFAFYFTGTRKALLLQRLSHCFLYNDHFYSISNCADHFCNKSHKKWMLVLTFCVKGIRRCPCSLQGSWNRWSSKVPSNTNYSNCSLIQDTSIYI